MKKLISIIMAIILIIPQQGLCLRPIATEKSVSKTNAPQDESLELTIDSIADSLKSILDKLSGPGPYGGLEVKIELINNRIIWLIRDNRAELMQNEGFKQLNNLYGKQIQDEIKQVVNWRVVAELSTLSYLLGTDNHRLFYILNKKRPTSFSGFVFKQTFRSNSLFSTGEFVMTFFPFIFVMFALTLVVNRYSPYPYMWALYVALGVYSFDKLFYSRFKPHFRAYQDRIDLIISMLQEEIVKKDRKMIRAASQKAKAFTEVDDDPIDRLKQLIAKLGQESGGDAKGRDNTATVGIHPVDMPGQISYISAINAAA